MALPPGSEVNAASRATRILHVARRPIPIARFVAQIGRHIRRGSASILRLGHLGFPRPCWCAVGRHSRVVKPRFAA